MIKRIFRSIFGGKSEPVAGKIDAVALLSNEEPKDELVKAPTLPVEKGFTFAPDLRAETLEQLWSGKAIAGQAGDARSKIVAEIETEEAYHSKVDAQIDLDQSLKDYDDRKGHVVVPSSGFEYHGDRENVIFPHKRGKAHKDGHIYSLETTKGLIHLDGKSRHYNYLPFKTPVIAGTDFSEHTKVLESGEFRISQDGKVELPSASSLEGARAIESQRRLAQLAQDELQWAKKVSYEADHRVDGFGQDFDPRDGHTVASEIDEYWFLRECSLPHMQHQTYSVESGPEGTRLFEDSYDKQPELMLDMRHEDAVTKLQAAASDDRSLHLSWDRNAGTVKAELRAAADWREPVKESETRTEAPRSLPSNNSYSYRKGPRAEKERDPLPRDFTASGRIRSHGGGYHQMVKATGSFPNDQTYPERFTDPESGKSYQKTSYRKLDGSHLYVERR